METCSAFLAICAQRPVTRELWCFLWSVWLNGWENNREAGDLRRYHAHHDAIVMELYLVPCSRYSHLYHHRGPHQCVRPSDLGTDHGVRPDTSVRGQPIVSGARIYRGGTGGLCYWIWSHICRGEVSDLGTEVLSKCSVELESLYIYIYIYIWLSERLRYLRGVSNSDIVVLYLVVEIQSQLHTPVLKTNSIPTRHVCQRQTQHITAEPDFWYRLVMICAIPRGSIHLKIMGKLDVEIWSCKLKFE